MLMGAFDLRPRGIPARAEEIPCLVEIWYLAVASSFQVSNDPIGHVVPEVQMLLQPGRC